MCAWPRVSIWLSFSAARAARFGFGRGFALAGFFAGFRRFAAFLATAYSAAALRSTARQQGAGGGGNIGLPHQALADEDGRHAGRREPREVGRRVDAAFGDDNALARDLRRQPLADRERGLEGAQIAVVDADQPRFELQRALKLIFLMNFNQHVHAIGNGCIFDRLWPPRR